MIPNDQSPIYMFTCRDRSSDTGIVLAHSPPEVVFLVHERDGYLCWFNVPPRYAQNPVELEERTARDRAHGHEIGPTIASGIMTSKILDFTPPDDESLDLRNLIVRAFTGPEKGGVRKDRFLDARVLVGGRDLGWGTVLDILRENNRDGSLP